VALRGSGAWAEESHWRQAGEEVVAWGGLRSALSGDQRFGEEAQDRVVLEEVALVQPDRRRMAQKCAALQRGDVAEQGMTLHSNYEQGCEREERRASFSGSSSARIRPMSCGGGNDRGVQWPQRCPRSVAWRAL
jgi:hypothetical protein